MGISDRSRLDGLFKQALFEGISEEELSGVTMHGKCKLITDLVGALRGKVPQRVHGNAKVARSSLVTIVDTFEPSENFMTYQMQKRERFFNEISQDRYAGLRDRIMGWGDLETEVRQDTLIEASSLHQYSYLSGVADRIPINWVFHDESIPSRRHGVISVGGFSGDLTSEYGRIRQDISARAHFEDALTSFNTGHHETTHAIQFTFANAFHHNRINATHKLYEDARMFHAIEVNKAVIPCSVLKHSDQSAYQHQVHEVLADAEGSAISEALLDLSQ
ncbi:MAG: hypothetical protein ACTHOO_04105 [Alcanivorax sp.]